MFIPRDAAATARRLSAGFPIVWFTGPRQSGKTTLARHLRPELPYVSLEQPDEREFAAEDPRGFLARFPDGAILDEIQAAPNLPSWLQGIVDSTGRMGLFVLTGSQQPAIAQTISQSLAGRVGRVELLPFSARELNRVGRLPESLDDVLFRGGYPPIFDREVAPPDWLGNYVATYVERDVRQLAAVRDLETFTRFLRLCAARSGQVVNMTSLGSDAGVSAATVKAWLSILRATYIIDFVEPYFGNITTRLTKQPKLLFLDVGLMAYLVGIRRPSHLAVHPLRGALFETWGLVEVLKTWRNAGIDQRLTYLRDKRGGEIDLAYDSADGLAGLEFKSGATIASDWARAFQLWGQRMSPTLWDQPSIVYSGEDSMVRGGVSMRAWRDFAESPVPTGADV